MSNLFLVVLQKDFEVAIFYFKYFTVLYIACRIIALSD